MKALGIVISILIYHLFFFLSLAILCVVTIKPDYNENFSYFIVITSSYSLIILGAILGYMFAKWYFSDPKS